MTDIRQEDDPRDVTEGRYAHIKVNAPSMDAQAGALDEDELIEIGVPSRGESTTDGASGGQRDASEGVQGDGNPPGGEHTPVEEADVDYSLDDLQPMPVTQKVILFVLIALVVVGGAWIFNYFTGFIG